MAKAQLTSDLVKRLVAPEKGYRITYDSELTGFGVRIMASGAISFILNYRTTSGLERRYTIGDSDSWSLSAARKRAEELKRRIRSEHYDPLAELEKRRTDVKMNELCDMFIREHLPKKAPATQRDYKQLIDTYIRPKLKHEPVAELQFRQVNDLFSDITNQGKQTTANRAMSVLSKMFSEARKRGWASHNPTEGVEKNEEVKRERFLDADELDRLLVALATLEDQEAANIFRLILLTGARKSEVLAAKWSAFDLKTGTWTKLSHHTKQRKIHNIPLSAPARQLLSEIREAAGNDRGEYVFPAHFESTKEVTKHPKPYRVNVKNQWARVLKAAKLEDLHIHDLRHSFASFLVSEGMSLPLIGRLLGHTQAQTTHRYAHLALDPLRAATERVGAIVTPKAGSGTVIQLRKEIP
ncbi:site-specific integrase [Rhizobium leguminosarum]|uniref:tyrosine-type recombinase/integrase n=1 Tax=Rhizobium leguminosarum TaxID=384 RepID=UPI001C91ACA4|nr:site-specific integrase [Rhizobium leguminosarum]MBY3027581.1 site-specific integrase [Rhizobium leguminosarum]